MMENPTATAALFAIMTFGTVVGGFFMVIWILENIQRDIETLRQAFLERDQK